LYSHHRLTICLVLGGTIIDVVSQIFHQSSPVYRLLKIPQSLCEHISLDRSMNNLHIIQYGLALYPCIVIKIIHEKEQIEI
jgi:hypothetical protein